MTYTKVTFNATEPRLRCFQVVGLLRSWHIPRQLRSSISQQRLVPLVKSRQVCFLCSYAKTLEHYPLWWAAYFDIEVCFDKLKLAEHFNYIFATPKCWNTAYVSRSINSSYLSSRLLWIYLLGIWIIIVDEERCCYLNIQLCLCPAHCHNLHVMLFTAAV